MQHSLARHKVQSCPPRPDIVEVISRYTSLRKSGRQFWALCPFHKEKTPSFAVDETKGVFYCHACHVGGDAIRFIELIEGVDFKTAVARLGIETYRPSPAQLEERRRKKQIEEWATATSKTICAAMREIGDEIRVCRLARTKPYTDKILLAGHEVALIREWAILTDLDDDLHDPKLAVEMWERRGDIDGLVGSL